jgi:hypothetical protein
VEILGIEELGLPLLDPLGAGKRLTFWAMAVAAAVVGNASELTLIALLDMAAQSAVRQRSMALMMRSWSRDKDPACCWRQASP